MHPRRVLALALLLSAALALLLAGPAPLAARAAPRAAWSWPIAEPRMILRAYRAPTTPYASGHRGVDFAVAAGTAVRSPDDGVVHFAGMVGDRPVLSLRHADGVLSSFEPVEAKVGVGQAVRRGDVVAVVTSSPGHCPEDCLHIGARISGRYLSPLALLGVVPRAVLLPLARQALG